MSRQTKKTLSGRHFTQHIRRALQALCVLASSFACPAADVQPAVTQEWVIPADQQIRDLLAQRMKHNGVGVVIGVIEPAGRRVVAYGRSDAPNGRPLDGDSIFQIGSVSKTFVGLVLSDMVLRGEVKLDDPAQKYLPRGVKMPQRGRPITLADLQTHMSGLPSMPTNMDVNGKPDPTEAYSVRQLYRFLSNYKLTREPGTRPEYSNVGVSLLGRLLGLREKKEYEALLEERVLQPLGMTSTAIRLSSEQLQRVTPGHDKDLLPVHSPVMKTLYPSGSIQSSVNDLLKYLAANLGYTDSPLTEAMLFQRTAVRVPTTPGPQSASSIVQALGWKIRMIDGREIYYHDGGKQGYRSGVAFDPVRRTGVIVLSNVRTDDQPIALARHILAGETLREPPPAVAVRTFAKIDEAILDSYAGEYRADSGDVFRVASRDGHLIVDSVGSGWSYFLPQNAHDFGTRVDRDEVSFRVNANGKVTGLVYFPKGRSEGSSQEAVRVH